MLSKTTRVSRSLRFVAIPKRTYVSVKEEKDTPQMSTTTKSSGDAFSKREEANENMYFKNQEAAKLKTLMQKLEDQNKTINELHGEVRSMMNASDKKDKEDKK